MWVWNTIVRYNFSITELLDLVERNHTDSNDNISIIGPSTDIISLHVYSYTCNTCTCSCRWSVIPSVLSVLTTSLLTIHNHSTQFFPSLYTWPVHWEVVFLWSCGLDSNRCHISVSCTCVIMCSGWVISDCTHHKNPRQKVFDVIGTVRLWVHSGRHCPLYFDMTWSRSHLQWTTSVSSHTHFQKSRSQECVHRYRHELCCGTSMRRSLSDLYFSVRHLWNEKNLQQIGDLISSHFKNIPTKIMLQNTSSLVHTCTLFTVVSLRKLTNTLFLISKFKFKDSLLSRNPTYSRNCWLLIDS